MSYQGSISIPNVVGGMGNERVNVGRFPAGESQKNDWITNILREPEHLDDNVLPLRLYKDLHVITAGYEMSKGHADEAMRHLKFAARTCFDLGQNEQGTYLLDRIDAIQTAQVGTPNKESSYRGYQAALQKEADGAIKAGDFGRTRDLLRQLSVLSTSMGDKAASRHYDDQQRSIETVYAAKGSSIFTVKKLFRTRLIQSLQEATLRRELAFRVPLTDRTSALQPILSHAFSA